MRISMHGGIKTIKFTIREYLKKTTASSECVQQEIQKIRDKLKWLDNFEHELNRILSI